MAVCLKNWYGTPVFARCVVDVCILCCVCMCDYVCMCVHVVDVCACVTVHVVTVCM